MLTLTVKQEQILRWELSNYIGRTPYYYGYKIVSEGARGERIYFKTMDCYGNYHWSNNITTTQAKEMFNIK